MFLNKKEYIRYAKEWLLFKSSNEMEIWNQKRGTYRQCRIKDRDLNHKTAFITAGFHIHKGSTN